MVKCGEHEFHGGGECACGVVGSPPLMLSSLLIFVTNKQTAAVYFFRAGVLFSIENAKFWPILPILLFFLTFLKRRTNIYLQDNIIIQLVS